MNPGGKARTTAAPSSGGLWKTNVALPHIVGKTTLGQSFCLLTQIAQKIKLNTLLTEWSGLNEVDEDDEVFEGNRETVEHPVRCNQDLMSGVLYSQK